MFSFGTRTSTKNSSANSESPRMVWIGRTVMPGDFRSISSMVMPAWRGFACGSVRTSANIQSAKWPLVVHILWPLTTKLSPSSTARVERLARSEPAPGSE